MFLRARVTFPNLSEGWPHPTAISPPLQHESRSDACAFDAAGVLEEMCDANSEALEVEDVRVAPEVCGDGAAARGGDEYDVAAARVG